MKKFKLSYILTFLGIVAFTTSCFDDPGTDILLTNSFVEIQEATTSGGTDIGKAYNRLNDGIGKRDSIRVNLVGKQRSAPISVNFSVDASSTAVAGVHYNLISTSSVSIPANESFGYIYFEVLADNIDVGENWKLKINLTGVDAADVKLSEKYKTFTRTMRIVCAFDRSKFVGTYSVVEPGYGTYSVTSTADTDPNSIVIDNFWDFSGVVKYTFNPANNQVTLPTQDVVMGGVTYVVAQGAGASTYKSCEYSFIVPYTVTRKSDSQLQDTNVHTFTKQ